MSKQKLLTVGTLAALGLMAVFSMQAKAAAAAAAAQDGQEGMVVVRDAQTGKLRAPTPTESKALRAQAPSSSALAGTAAPRATNLAARPDGARGVRLGEKTMVYEVVTRGADGKLSAQCVEGADSAAAALDHPAADHTHTASGENVHESR